MEDTDEVPIDIDMNANWFRSVLLVRDELPKLKLLRQQNYAWLSFLLYFPLRFSPPRATRGCGKSTLEQSECVSGAAR